MAVPKKRIGISKLDAAKRQLETAIRLFLNQKDPVSTHTLVAAAHELLYRLSRENQTKSLIWPEGLNFVDQKLKNKYHKKVREAQTFFKHAALDKDEMLDFNSEATAFFMLDACMMYESLTGEKTVLVQLFFLWFVTNYPEPWKGSPFAEAAKDVVAHLPPNPSPSAYLSLIPELEKVLT